MAVVTPQQYREYTDDVTHFWTEIETWLADAQGLVEEHLRRQLESMARTEVLLAAPWRAGGWSVRGALYPTAYPVTVVPAGYRVRHGRIVLAGSAALPWDFLVEPYGDGVAEVTLTYTGGYTEATLPVHLRNAIINVAEALGDPKADPMNLHPRASSVTLGDASVTLRASAETAASELDELVPGVTKRLKGWRNML